MKKQFFISGLGADERAFQGIPDIGTEKIMIDWIPNEEKESLHNYAQRLIALHDIKKEDIVTGLSLGGLVAQHIGEILQSEYVILISSFQTKADLKFIFNKGLKYRLFKLLPDLKSNVISDIVASYINSSTNVSKPVLKDMILNTDHKLMMWSIEKIYEQDTAVGDNLIKYNIIGTDDRIVKCWENNHTYKIKGGSHIMVFDKADEVAQIMKSIIFSEVR